MRSELQHEREQALHRLDLRMSIGEVFLYGIRNSCKMIYLMMITMLDYRMLEEGEREWKQNESRLSEPQTAYRMGWS